MGGQQGGGVRGCTAVRRLRAWPQGFAGELDYDKEMGAMERRGGQSPKQGGGKFRDRGAPAKGKGPMNRARAVKDAKFGACVWNVEGGGAPAGCCMRTVLGSEVAQHSAP